MTVEQGLIDELTLARFFARIQRGEDAQRRPHARGHVGDGDRPAHGFAVEIAGGGHEARFALRHEIVAAATGIRPAAAIARDGAENQSGVVGAHRFRIESHFLQRFHFAHVAHKDIGLFQQAAHGVFAVSLPMSMVMLRLLRLTARK